MGIELAWSDGKSVFPEDGKKVIVVLRYRAGGRHDQTTVCFGCRIDGEWYSMEPRGGSLHPVVSQPPYGDGHWVAAWCNLPDSNLLDYMAPEKKLDNVKGRYLNAEKGSRKKRSAIKKMADSN